MTGFDCVVWDFDGVLNANIRDGELVWASTVVDDIGHGVEDFLDDLFADAFSRVVIGEEDLLDHVRLWADAAGYAPGPEHFLDYWFEKDALPDPVLMLMMEILAKRGIASVIATNNEVRRADYIENQMGFGKRIVKMFCSGRMGVAKPAPEFFIRVQQALNIPHNRLILIDDRKDNVGTAQMLGWQGYHYSEDDHSGLRTRLGLA
ncbi:MAG: HAD-IA family hydrolase [Pseudomonadota bacterium]